MAEVLLIEDDVETAEFVRDGLIHEGHRVECYFDGGAGLIAARTGSHDALVIDRMLPSLDGVRLLQTLRAEGIQSPAMFLSAKGAVGERIEGLEAGADDYLVKPFDISELKARLAAMLRRPALAGADGNLRIGDLQIERLNRRVTRRGSPIPLQAREYQILEYLALNAGRVVTRSMLLKAVWGFNFNPETNIVETHISRLRSKIDEDGSPSIIRTVRGAGYCFRAA